MTEDRPLLQVVKYRWANAHGVSFIHWTTASIGPDIQVPFGHGRVTEFEVLDTHPIPERIRRTGWSSVLASHVILAMRRTQDVDIEAERFVELMEEDFNRGQQ